VPAAAKPVDPQLCRVWVSIRLATKSQLGFLCQDGCFLRGTIAAALAQAAASSLV
jgi:hypothetical protein